MSSPSKTYALKSFLTVGDLRRMIQHMSDDAIVTARDRDCISLDQVHVVGVGERPEAVPERVRYVPTVDHVYGGEGHHLDNPSKQAIILCDND